MAEVLAVGGLRGLREVRTRTEVLRAKKVGYDDVRFETLRPSSWPSVALLVSVAI